MHIFKNQRQGFSLTELLVVIAITGVLAAVSVVGYQGYIDSTKKSVTESNALSVQQWFRSTSSVRQAALEVNPSACRNLPTNTAVGCVTSLTQAGGPFQNFKNSYDNSRPPASTVQAQAVTSGWTQSTDSGTTACPSGVELGDIVVEVAINAPVNTTYEFWYCDKGSGGAKTMYTKDNWIVTWE